MLHLHEGPVTGHIIAKRIEREEKKSKHQVGFGPTISRLRGVCSITELQTLPAQHARIEPKRCLNFDV